MIPYARQSISKLDIEMVTSALNQEMITTGPLVDKFEEQLSGYLGAETFVVNSGTAALHCAYFGIGIESGDEIITPANTFIATQATAANLGAKIVFADVDKKTGLISLDSVRSTITSRTKAIVLVDFAGQPCDIDEIRNLIGSRKIFVIEDAAHSIGSLYKGRKVGSLADITTFSFFATKNITTGEGGAVSTNNQTIYQRAKRFSRQGLVREDEEFVLDTEGPWHQEVHEFGLNYRLTDFQCALGLSQLARIEEFKRSRKYIFERYRKLLIENQNIRLLEVKEYSDSMWHLFPIFVDSDIRLPLFKHLRSKNIGVQVNYFPAHLHPVFRRIPFSNSPCPNAESFYKEEISLPIHAGVTEENVDYIVKTVEDFFK